MGWDTAVNDRLHLEGLQDIVKAAHVVQVGVGGDHKLDVIGAKPLEVFHYIRAVLVVAAVDNYADIPDVYEYAVGVIQRQEMHRYLFCGGVLGVKNLLHQLLSVAAVVETFFGYPEGLKNH